MRIHNIASSLLLCGVLLFEHDSSSSRASAFGVIDPVTARRRTTKAACSNSRPHTSTSSLYAFDPLEIVDAATAALSSLGPEIDTIKDAVTSNIPISFDAAVVGAVCLPIGWTLGVLSQQGGNKKAAVEETTRLENVLQEKTNEIKTLNTKLEVAEVKRIETKEAMDRLEKQVLLWEKEREESTETLRNDFEQQFPGLLQIVRYDVDKVLQQELKNDTVHLQKKELEKNEHDTTTTVQPLRQGTI